MIDHIIFLIYILIIISSTIGYGFIFSKLINEEYLKLNIGYQGLFGFLFLVIISSISSFFFKHGYFHNLIIQVIGLIFFIYYFNLSTKKDKLLFAFIFFIILISIYIYKSHDDFPYYHLTYALTLTENKFIIGLGNLGHGFRTFSSLFYFHSILYLPFIDQFLFNLGPFLILLFFNFIIIKKILSYLYKKKEISFILFFCLFSFSFVNIAFYRIAEHGTDRSPQIIIFLIFIVLFEILFQKKNSKKKIIYFETFLLLLVLASSLKALYYIYVAILPLILTKYFFKNKIYTKLNYRIAIPILIGLSLNLIINFLNTGCLLYPETKSCFNTKWSIPIEEVRDMRIHYEWWAKAGGGPGYKHELGKKDYVKNFNWTKNWVEKHFFNKVSDTLLGIIFICLLYFILFRTLAVENKLQKKTNYLYIYLIYLVLTLEWFFGHPAMRYGGYVLGALPVITFFASRLDKYNFNFLNARKLILILIIVVSFVFEIRNMIRLNKEVKFYNYNLWKSPNFYEEKVKSNVFFEIDNLKIYRTENNKMCWSSKTLCSSRTDLKAKKILNYYMLFRE